MVQNFTADISKRFLHYLADAAPEMHFEHVTMVFALPPQARIRFVISLRYEDRLRVTI